MLASMKTLVFSLLLILAQIPGALGASPTVAELAQAARDAKARGESHRALYYLQQVLLIDPGNQSALRAQARLLAAEGYPVQAGQRWQQLPLDAEAQQGLIAAAAVSQVASAAPAEPSPMDNGGVGAPEAAAAPSLEAGQGVWVNGDLPGRIKAINAYNLKAPRLQRLRHVFVAAGSIHVVKGQPVLTLDLRPVRIAGSGLQGEAQAHLWLTVLARGARGVKPQAWQALAAELAAALKDERRISGIHLSPDTGTEALAPLFEALRAQLKLPLSILVPTATPADFQRVDLVVLRGWGRGTDLDAYSVRIRDQVSAFLKAAGPNQGKAMIGLPVRGPQGAETFRAGRDAIGAVLTPDQPGPMGLGLMGLVDDSSGLSADWVPGVWQQAAIPVAGP
jgi:hypothetical protein